MGNEEGETGQHQVRNHEREPISRGLRRGMSARERLNPPSLTTKHRTTPFVDLDRRRSRICHKFSVLLLLQAALPLGRRLRRRLGRAVGASGPSSGNYARRVLRRATDRFLGSAEAHTGRP